MCPGVILKTRLKARFVWGQWGGCHSPREKHRLEQPHLQPATLQQVYREGQEYSDDSKTWPAMETDSGTRAPDNSQSAEEELQGGLMSNDEFRKTVEDGVTQPKGTMCTVWNRFSVQF